MRSYKTICLCVLFALSVGRSFAQEYVVRVKDIYPGLSPLGPVGSSRPGTLTEFQGKLFFAADDGVHGRELWKSSGTEAGTELVCDIRPGATGSGPLWFEVMGDYLYFTANDGVTGTELWRSDGTALGTTLVRDINTTSSIPQYLTNVNGTLFFSANDGIHDRELWVSDGTPEGTTMVEDTLTTGSGFPYINTTNDYYITHVGQARGLFFYRGETWIDNPSGLDSLSGLELFASNGGATWMTKNLMELWWNSMPSYFATMGDTLYFSGDDGIHANEVFRSDGTEGGTRIVKDIYVPAGSSPQYLKATSDRVYFSADDVVHGRELWVTDGSEGGTHRLTDFNPGTAPSSPTDIWAVGDALYFSATDPVNGREPRVVLGTGQGAQTLKNIAAGSLSSDPRYFRGRGSFCYFQANDGVNGKEFWRTDGTEENTEMYADINPGAASSEPENIFVAGGILYFTAEDGQTGFELYRLADPGIAPPQPPSDPGATNITTDSLVWVWQDNSDNELGFHIFRGMGDTAPGAPVATLGFDVEAWHDTGRTPNTKYTFQVDAYNSAGPSAKTDVLSAWTLPLKPGSPTLGSATDNSFRATVVADGNTSSTQYCIGVSTNPGPTLWVRANGSLSPTPGWRTRAQWGSIKVTGLEMQTTYRVFVGARNGGGAVSYGSAASIRTLGTEASHWSILP